MSMVFVTGAARSGTSLTTQILQAMGCYLGDPKQVNSLYENVSIRQNLLKPYLKSVGADPMGQNQLPDTFNLPSQLGLKEKVLEHFKDCPNDKKPLYKDAKLTLVFPVWAEAFPDAKWVIVRRKAERIADSCVRTSFMRHHGDNKQAWIDWVKEHEKRFEAMLDSLNAIEIWTDEYVRNADVFAPLAMFLGLKWNPQVVRNNVKMNMWHG